MWSVKNEGYDMVSRSSPPRKQNNNNKKNKEEGVCQRQKRSITRNII